MNEISINLHEGKIEVKVKINGVGELKLEPKEAIELGLRLLKAAYAAKKIEKPQMVYEIISKLHSSNR